MSACIRLAKYLSHAGVCSRRGASRLIDAGRVTVNGRAANHIDHVSEQDEIIVDGERVDGLAAKRYYAYHKPIGIDCKLKTEDSHSLIHHLPPQQRTYPIGRLDKDSRGLLILTNDGELCNQLAHPDHSHEKEYWVEVDKPLDEAFYSRMSAGVPVNGILTKPCVCTPLSPTRFKIILTQGLNRQIRKMARYCGYRVVDLLRVRIGQLHLDCTRLAENQFIELTPEEVKLLKK
ncbi:pseudouridine synthase [Pseudoalteromonas sp. T1lg48]|uniref:pseudouridine synthase n=1 Tax=Pseudoalteromonas sp. T1lg48 TaxID=2077100 RepID=UPI000CF683BE|nr:pseudouridine synthase [Pseudoalteromonas sp. T1lg48]